MQIIQFSPLMLLAIFPEIGWSYSGALVLILDLVWKGEQRRSLPGWWLVDW